MVSEEMLKPYVFIEPHLTEDGAGLAMGLLHQTENGEVPVVELTHERLHPRHHHGVQGQSRLVLPGAGKKWEMEVRIGDFPLPLVTEGKTVLSSF